jgi:hypothetical protein
MRHAAGAGLQHGRGRAAGPASDGGRPCAAALLAAAARRRRRPHLCDRPHARLLGRGALGGGAARRGGRRRGRAAGRGAAGAHAGRRPLLLQLLLLLPLRRRLPALAYAPGRRLHTPRSPGGGGGGRGGGAQRERAAVRRYADGARGAPRAGAAGNGLFGRPLCAWRLVRANSGGGQGGKGRSGRSAGLFTDAQHSGASHSQTVRRTVSPAPLQTPSPLTSTSPRRPGACPGAAAPWRWARRALRGPRPRTRRGGRPSALRRPRPAPAPPQRRRALARARARACRRTAPAPPAPPPAARRRARRASRPRAPAVRACLRPGPHDGAAGRGGGGGGSGAGAGALAAAGAPRAPARGRRVRRAADAVPPCHGSAQATPSQHPPSAPPPHIQVQNEDPTHERLQLFNRLWAAAFAADSLLVFSTGRSPALFAELWVRRGGGLVEGRGGSGRKAERRPFRLACGSARQRPHFIATPQHLKPHPIEPRRTRRPCWRQTS